MQKLIVLLLILALAACGGDGGGNGASSGFSLESNNITIEVEHGQELAPFAINGSLVNVGDEAYGSATLQYSSRVIDRKYFLRIDDATAQLIIVPNYVHLITPGVYHDEIIVSVCVDSTCNQQVPGSPQTVTLDVTVKDSKPLPSIRIFDTGVAFVVMPGMSKLTRSLPVEEIGDNPQGWTAVSHQPDWLSVTPNGTGQDPMVISANPANLPDGFYMGSITITANNPDVLNTETIKVGLYVSSVTSVTESVQLRSDVACLKEDPIRPIVYVCYGAQSTIDAYHIYTGELINSYAIENARIDALTISDDGSVLYALGNTGSSVRRINLETSTMMEPHTFADYDLRDLGNSIIFTRVNQMPVLILSDFEYEAENPFGLPSLGGRTNMMPIIHADTGKYLGKLYPSSQIDSIMTASQDGKALFSIEKNISGIQSPLAYNLSVNSLGNVNGYEIRYPFLDSLAGINTGRGHDIATNLAGDRFYALYHSMLSATFTGSDYVMENPLPSATTEYYSNIEVNPYGNIVASTLSKIYIYNDNESLIGEADAAIADDVLRLSGDGLRIIYPESASSQVPNGTVLRLLDLPAN